MEQESEHTDNPTGWVAEPRDVFEYSMIPWVGRQAAAWLRTTARQDPADPTGLVLVPERVSRVFHANHVPYQHVTKQQLLAMGYPRLPEDDALERAEKQLERASRVGDTNVIEQLLPEVERLKVRADLAHRAVDAWAHDTERVEEELPRALVTDRTSEAPNALVGIPPELADAGDEHVSSTPR